MPNQNSNNRTDSDYEADSDNRNGLSTKIIDTITDLYKQPVQVVDGFVEGVRGRYLNPFLYMGLSALVLAVITSFVVHYPEIEVTPANQEQLEHLGEELEGDRAEELHYVIEIIGLIANTQFLGFLHFFLFPVLAVTSMLFFRDTHEGFYRHLIMNCYAVGQANVAMLVVIPVWIFFNDQLMNPSIHLYPAAFLAGLILLYMYNRYLNIEYITGWMKAFSALILGYFIYSLIAGFLIAVIAFLIYMAMAIGAGG